MQKFFKIPIIVGDWNGGISAEALIEIELGLTNSIIS